LKIITNSAPTMKTKTRGKSRTMSLDPTTTCAVDDMFRWMAQNSPVDYWTMPGTRRREMNQMIQAMCQAVVNYTPPVKGAFYFPLVFEARNETREEQALRMMLQALEAGEPITPDEA
jgi:hypothetical protein